MKRAPAAPVTRASWVRQSKGSGGVTLVPVRVLTPPPEVPFGPHAGLCLGLEMKETGAFRWVFTPRGKRRRMWKVSREEAELEAMCEGDTTGREEQLALFRSRKDIYLSACGGAKGAGSSQGAGDINATGKKGAGEALSPEGCRRRRMRFDVAAPRPVVPFGPHQGTELRFAVKRNGSQYWQFRNAREGGRQQAWANVREEAELERIVRGCCNGFDSDSEACEEMRGLFDSFQASKQEYAQAYYEAADAAGVNLNVVKYRRRSVYPLMDLDRAPRPVVPYGPYAGLELSYTVGTKWNGERGSGAWSFCAEAQGRRRRHWGLRVEQAELERLAYDPDLTHEESKERAALLREFQRAQQEHVNAYMEAHAQARAVSERRQCDDVQ